MDISLQPQLRPDLIQTLSPQMIQSLKLLQYSNLQLEQSIRQEIQENPILEEMTEEDSDDEEASADEEVKADAEAKAEADAAPADEAAPTQEKEEAAAVNESDPESDDNYSEGFDLGYRRTEDERSDEMYEKIATGSLSLEEHLLRQLNEKKFSPKDAEIAEFIIGNIDERGYLVSLPEEIAKGFEVEVARVEDIRRQIQRFEPLGVASLNLRECLLVQIWHGKGTIHPLMEKIVSEQFELLRKYQIPEIARRLNAPIADVQAAVKEIGRLEPRPGTLVSGQGPQIIVPDLVVVKLDSGEFAVSLNDGHVPNLRVSQSYLRLLKTQKKSPDIRKYLSEKMNAANWLIRSIEQRKITMLKVMTAIVEKQREWFEKGPPNQKPLILQSVADEIGMHISTVCRVTNNKYVQTPYGIFELKYFFGSGVDQGDGTEVSTSQAREVLKELIRTEDKKRPHSDQKLVELLKERDILVARRTISKYREQLNILPARLRKEF